MRITRLIISIMMIVLLIYSLVTQDVKPIPYITLLFGVLMVLYGLGNMKNKGKGKTKHSGYMSVIYMVIALVIIIILGSFTLR